MGFRAADSLLHRVAAAVLAGTARVVVVSAPAGYGKSTLLAGLGRFVGQLKLCVVSSPDAAEFSRSILAAMFAGDGVRADQSAADRLAQSDALAASTARETLRAEWSRAGETQLFVLHDAAGALSTPGGADVFSELIALLPASRTLAVSTRSPLPPALQQVVSKTRLATVQASDLALTYEEVSELALAGGHGIDVARTLFAIADGWPLVTRLLLGLLRRDSLDELVEASRALDRESLLAFGVHRTTARLDDHTRNALVVAELLGGASHAQVVRVLGDEYDDLVFARLASLAFAAREGDRIVVHAEAALILRDRFRALVARLYERTLNALAGEGAYVDAAEVALDFGDGARAAAIIDAAPPYTVATVPLAAYQRILDRIDPALVVRYPNVWIATIPYRSFSVERAVHIREAETVYFCLPPAAGNSQRSAALMLLASAYLNVGRVEESNRLIDDALTGYARTDHHARASLLNYSASVHGMEGRFAIARQLANESSRCARDPFGESQTLHYIDAHEAAYRGQVDRVVVIIDELLRRLAPAQLPIHRAHAATNGALFCWVSGDESSFQKYLTELECALTPGIERGFRPMIDAARGLPMCLDWDYPWPVIAAVAHLYRLGVSSDLAEARDAASKAAAAADHKRDPYTQILAHSALYVLLPDSRADEGKMLESLVSSIESPEMKNAVKRLLRGESPGILDPFIRHRVLRNRQGPASRLALELLSGRVVQDGVPLRLSEKEFELIALVGSSFGSLSRDRIGEALWEHLDPEEWPNNLKVTLSRLRSRLGSRDSVVVADSRYRLSPMIDVDLWRAEKLLRQVADQGIDDRAWDDLGAVAQSYRAGEGRYARFAWARGLEARIAELVCSAGLILAKKALNECRYDDVSRHVDDVLAADSLNEQACELRIRAALHCGDADAARRELQRYERVLAKELGSKPTRRLIDLVGAVT